MTFFTARLVRAGITKLTVVPWSSKRPGTGQGQWLTKLWSTAPDMSSTHQYGRFEPYLTGASVQEFSIKGFGSEPYKVASSTGYGEALKVPLHIDR